ncbi:hypothetical protein A0H81_11970 [Grifola frondosa]|uniref:Glycopeptide n=1 Tax=Grifola frondosa TaxID=5627 RepID=A0A1C7LW34_GRIFR|nr:hypothetical protein A0H81_11970 [Grifola frondosa]
MFRSIFAASLATVLIASTGVSAEQHIIRFQNNCGKGTPQLVQGGQILSTGQDYVSNGPFSGGIAYLQTGECLLNGEECTLLEMTLGNPTVPGGGSSTDISLIPPHAFNVEASFSYFDGCDGSGATCSSSTCPTAFFQSNDNQVQVQCETDNVNLLISFCSDATKAVVSSSSSKPASTTASQSSSIAASSHSASSTAAVQSSSSAVSQSASSASASAPSLVVNPAPTPSSTTAVSESFTASPSTSSASTVANSSPSVPSRKTCHNNARRRAASTAPDSRAIYESHRRHHARLADNHAARRGSF